jgi:RNA polymerase sigma-70 factor, ECF subfamily
VPLDPPTEFERTALVHMRDCYAFALSLVRNVPDAEDLVQDTFLRAQRAFDSFEPGTNAKAWLFTILRRLHIDRHRRARNRPSFLPEEELEGIAPVPEGAPVPDEALRGLTGADVRRALESVPEAFRMAVRLRDVDGFDYKEIGRVLGVPPGTVMSRIHRGREWLKKALVPPTAGPTEDRLPDVGDAPPGPAARPRAPEGRATGSDAPEPA